MNMHHHCAGCEPNASTTKKGGHRTRPDGAQTAHCAQKVAHLRANDVTVVLGAIQAPMTNESVVISRM
jgi:hypothetical protein